MRGYAYEQVNAKTREMAYFSTVFPLSALLSAHLLPDSGGMYRRNGAQYGVDASV
ncbi:hypothetical protein GCM10007086_05850 [Photobacterium aphoticum]|nr:hypothetical protein GCM10007086_05850 [Photobacterium aphoticum]